MSRLEFATAKLGMLLDLLASRINTRALSSCSPCARAFASSRRTQPRALLNQGGQGLVEYAMILVLGVLGLSAGMPRLANGISGACTNVPIQVAAILGFGTGNNGHHSGDGNGDGTGNRGNNQGNGNDNGNGNRNGNNGNGNRNGHG